MLIGLDLDNTIVSYDRLFFRLAEERGLLTSGVPPTKSGVKAYLCGAGREAEWTALQGLAYGPRMNEADPFPGVHGFIRRCADAGTRVVIVSHKTRHPFVGPAYDLHDAARNYLAEHGLEFEHVYLELSKSAKIDRIRSLGCDYFVDDLPDILGDPEFPGDTRRVLFDPAGTQASEPDWLVAHSWDELGDTLLSGAVA